MALRVADEEEQKNYQNPLIDDGLEKSYNSPSADRPDPVSTDDLENIPTLGHEPLTPKQIKNAEETGRQLNLGRVGKDEKELADLSGGFNKGGITGGGDDSKDKKSFFVRNRRKTIGGVAGGGVIGILLAVFGVLQGPAELVHLSQILQKPTFGEQDASKDRLRGIIRYARTGNYGETRVGYLGSKLANRTISQLKSIGIEFENDGLGRPKSVSFDTTSEKSPYQGLSDEEVKSKIAEQHGISDSSRIRKSGSKFVIDLDLTQSSDIDLAKSLKSSTVAELGNGKILTALKGRNLATFFGLPRLFSPVSKKATQIETKLNNRATRIKAEKDRATPRRDAVAKRAAGARASLKSKLGGKAKATLTGSLIASAALCLVRSAASDVVAVNYASIVVPSAIEAEDKISVGSKVQSNKDINTDDAGAVKETFTDDDGKTIWGATALNALANNGYGAGEDIPSDFQQAFSNETTADHIKDTVSTHVAGVDVSGLVCSLPGQAVQVAISGVLIAAGPFTFGGSWAVFAAKAGAGAAATAGALWFLQGQLEKLISNDSIVPEVFSGPLGGNLLAYGSVVGADMTARASGGVELSDEESLALLNKQQEEEKAHSSRKVSLQECLTPKITDLSLLKSSIHKQWTQEKT